MSRPDTTVRCDGCGRTQGVNFADCIANGWPTCHGQTMQLATSPSAATIDRAVARRFAPAREALEEAHRG